MFTQSSSSARHSAYRAPSGERVKRRLALGIRWLRCGWRLFLRNPWLLGGMGITAAVLIGALSLIPLLGGLLLAFIAPVLLASAYLAIDAVSKQGMALPAVLRLAAFKRSPKELVRIFYDEEHLLPVAVAAVYSLAVALLISLVAQFVAGAAWSARWTSLDPVALFGVLTVALFTLLGYAVLAASLIYALPLAFLQDEPLVPALRRSLRAVARTASAHLAVLVLLLVPYLLGALLAQVSPASAVLVRMLAAAAILPLVTCSLYCAYRTLFPVHDEGTTR